MCYVTLRYSLHPGKTWGSHQPGANGLLKGCHLVQTHTTIRHLRFAARGALFVQLGAGGLANALCTALDQDGDGKIGTSELKGLLKTSGLNMLSSVASMIPDGKDVDYRALLARVK